MVDLYATPLMPTDIQEMRDEAQKWIDHRWGSEMPASQARGMARDILRLVNHLVKKENQEKVVLEALKAFETELETAKRFLEAEKAQCDRMGQRNLEAMAILGGSYPDGVVERAQALVEERDCLRVALEKAEREREGLLKSIRLAKEILGQAGARTLCEAADTVVAEMEHLRLALRAADKEVYQKAVVDILEWHRQQASELMADMENHVVDGKYSGSVEALNQAVAFHEGAMGSIEEKFRK